MNVMSPAHTSFNEDVQTTRGRAVTLDLRKCEAFGLVRRFFVQWIGAVTGRDWLGGQTP